MVPADTTVLGAPSRYELLITLVQQGSVCAFLITVIHTARVVGIQVMNGIESLVFPK